MKRRFILGLTDIFKKQKQDNTVSIVQTGRESYQPFSSFESFAPMSAAQRNLYRSLRDSIPVIDAAICKLIRLIGDFEITCSDKSAQNALNEFMKFVPVNGNSRGLYSFISSYFESLLTYGTALGEIVTTRDGYFHGLYNSDLSDIELKRNKNGFDVDVFVNSGGEMKSVAYPQFVLLSTLNPEPGMIQGNSILRGLPFVSSILCTIFNTIKENWERVGNIRFAVTYNPHNDSLDKNTAKESALQIASQWGEMQSSKAPRDFIAVGDVQIKVIGADNQILDSQIPVREILEQIIAKTGLPPFILGLSWSTTERMSSQQADILTTELENYRKILEIVILKICNTYLSMNGYSCKANVVWDDIMLQDMAELSRARLLNAQAEKLEKENKSEDRI